MTLKISSTTIKFEGLWVSVSLSVGTRACKRGGARHASLIILLFPVHPDLRDINNSESNPRGVLVFMSDLNAFSLLHNFAG